ncbi:MAG: hypothetical protein ACREVK_04260 [Gammaproteobacteria bacterium]
MFRNAQEALSFVCVVVYEIEQRNWSRVAMALMEKEGSQLEGERVFLKQYLDSAGRWHEHHWTYEREGIETGRATLQGLVKVAPIVGADAVHLVNAFEYCDITPMDVLLRRNPTGFKRAYPFALEQMREILERLQCGRKMVEGRELPVKKRDYGGPSTALNFKGFDFRNLGFKVGTEAAPQATDLAIFDLGRPYLAPIEEVAAKLMISIGLLNWGKPMSLFVQGPDLSLLETARKVLEPHLNGDALRAEIRLQRSFRIKQVQGKSGLERGLKHLGIDTIGRWYMQQLIRWCAEVT